MTIDQIGKYITIVCLLMATTAGAGDWPTYLGPTYDAVSPETGLAKSWPESGPKVLWTTPVGIGYGGPAIVNGKAYILDRIPKKQDKLRCLDMETGKDIWEFAYDAPGAVSFPGSRTVPAVDGDRVYINGQRGDVYCIDTNTHKPIWNKNIWTDNGGGDKLPMWAISQNPLVYRDLVILAAQTPKVGLIAYDKITGKVRWKTAPFTAPRPGYCSPIIIRIAGDDQVVFVTSGPTDPVAMRKVMGNRKLPEDMMPKKDGSDKGGVFGYDPETGKNLWVYRDWQTMSAISPPLAIGDGRIFVTSGYMAGSAMFRVDKKEGAYIVKELYQTKEFGTHVHPPVLFKGYLYGHCTDNTGRNDGMVCMDLDGNIQWKTGTKPLFDKGGLLVADGRIFSVDGKKGVLHMFQPNQTEYRSKGSIDLLDTDRCWAPLALSNGKLLIRDQKQMKCVDLR